MKVLKESEVPERVRLMRPAPRPATQPEDPLPAILRQLVRLASEPRAEPDKIDLQPVVEAIQALASAARPAPPQPVHRWKFTVTRGGNGLIQHIVAERIG